MWYTKIKNIVKINFLRLMSIFIILGLFFLAASAAQAIVQRLLNSDQNNLVIVDDIINPCLPFSIQTSERMYVLRLDDVQAFSWSDITNRIISYSLNRGFPIVAGIIPKNLNEDSDLQYFLRKNSCNIEMALHGWDHGLISSDGDAGVAEFETLTKEAAQERIENGQAVLESLTEETIVTFIPPQNRISIPAKEALYETGFQVISSEGKGLYDYKAATWNYGSDSFVTFSEIITKCDTAFETTNLCVIMIHPQDFLAEDTTIINRSKYNEFIKLIDYLSTHDADVITFKHLISSSAK